MKDAFLTLCRRLRLLPFLVVVATLAFVVRIGDAALQVRDLSGSAMAEEKTAEKPPEKTAEKTPSPEIPAKPGTDDKAMGLPDLPSAKDVASDKKETADAKEDKPGAVDLPSTAAPAWSDAADGDIDYSTLRKELYNDLLQRRQQLDEKEKVLSQREALLEAGDKELNRKFQELTGLRDEIKELLKTQSKEEDARIASLVKIYEGMKPKDAARIFDTLDMDILLDVVSKMSERKASAVIALMDSERARSLTTLLAEQKKLPELPGDGLPEAPTN